MRVLTCIIAVAVCIAVAAPVRADTKFGPHENQRSIPQLDFGLQPVVPGVGGGLLMVPVNGKMEPASSDCVPYGAWIYIDLRAAWGERPGDEVVVRIKGVEAAKLWRDRNRTEQWLRDNPVWLRNIVLGETPFELYISTNGMTPQRYYPVEVLGIRNDRIYADKLHSFYLDVNPLAAYQQPNAQPQLLPAPSRQIDPMTLPVAAEGQSLVFGYVGCKGDQLVACVQYPTPVALVQVYKIEGQVAYANVLRGAIPQDTAVTLHKYMGGGRAR